MTPVATFRAQFVQGMAALAAGLPNARSSSRASRTSTSSGRSTGTASAARSVWTLAGICQSMLATPWSTSPADVARRARVRQRNIDYNTQLAQVCAPTRIAASTATPSSTRRSSRSDVTTRDYFHPSVAGQTKLAAVTWAATCPTFVVRGRASAGRRDETSSAAVLVVRGEEVRRADGRFVEARRACGARARSPSRRTPHSSASATGFVAVLERPDCEAERTRRASLARSASRLAGSPSARRRPRRRRARARPGRRRRTRCSAPGSSRPSARTGTRTRTAGTRPPGRESLAAVVVERALLAVRADEERHLDRSTAEELAAGRGLERAVRCPSSRGEEALGVERAHAARPGRGDRLPVDVILHVADGEDARDVRLGRARLRDQVARLVVVELVEEELRVRVVADRDEQARPSGSDRPRRSRVSRRRTPVTLPSSTPRTSRRRRS